MKKFITKALGISKRLSQPVRTEEENTYWEWVHSDFTPTEKSIIKQVLPYSMTSHERLVSLIRAVEHLCHHRIDGDFVECGVWKGGSAMAMALALKNFGDMSRKIHLYDTYDGMSEPTGKDESIDGKSAEIQLKASSKENPTSVWCYSGLDEVQANMRTTLYPEQNIAFIKGKVEETIPQQIPESIALLRLDTDWYESTKHELEHLFPRLVRGGVLIIDDYGHWKGSKRAVDEYLHEQKLPLFLFRIDYTCRMAIKP
jgi:hypothetical protein